MTTTNPIPLTTFAPPMTLSHAQRAIVESWPHIVRADFEAKAAMYEYGEHMTTAEAESAAFSHVIIKLSLPVQM